LLAGFQTPPTTLPLSKDHKACRFLEYRWCTEIFRKLAADIRQEVDEGFVGPGMCTPGPQPETVRNVHGMA
jgi:hypothetical protein